MSGHKETKVQVEALVLAMKEYIEAASRALPSNKATAVDALKAAVANGNDAVEALAPKPASATLMAGMHGQRDSTPGSEVKPGA